MPLMRNEASHHDLHSTIWTYTDWAREHGEDLDSYTKDFSLGAANPEFKPIRPVLRQCLSLDSSLKLTAWRYKVNLTSSTL